MTVRSDAERLAWLAELIQHCPHAEIIYNDDEDDEDPVGFTIRVESCSRMELTAPTLQQAIDLGINAEPDEDNNVIAKMS